MSRSFLGIPALSYIGQPQVQPVKQISPLAKVIPLNFDWLTYQAGFPGNPANVAARCNLTNLGPAGTIDKIVSVYIDNLGNPCPVYVFFPDTQNTITAQAFSAGWYLVFTNQYECLVVVEGLTPAQDVHTRVLISNIFMPPNTDIELSQALSLWLASPTISRGNTIYNQNFGVPALGDQFNSPVLDLTTPGGAGTVNLWNTPQTGFLYITSMSINVANFSDLAVKDWQLTVESTGVSGILGVFRFGSNGSTRIVYLNIYQLSGMQIKLNAAETWRLRVSNNAGQGASTGYATCYSTYTINPQ